MKILKESKENLPVAFITSFVSDGWEKVGILKEQIEAIKKEFKGTKKVEDLIQDLIDAYLICIGQLEKHLSDKDYLDFEPTEVKEALKENLLHFIIDAKSSSGRDLRFDSFAKTEEEAKENFLDKYKQYEPEIVKIELDANKPIIKDEALKEDLSDDVTADILDGEADRVAEENAALYAEEPCENCGEDELDELIKDSDEKSDEDKEMDAFEAAILAAKPLTDGSDDVIEDDDAPVKKSSGFEYFDEFPEPDMSAPLTDDDIYGKK